MVNSRYFAETVRSKLGIVLALVQNPTKYDYTHLKATGRKRIELTRDQVEQLARLRGVVEKECTNEKVVDFVLAKAVKQLPKLEDLLKFVSTDYFAKKVRNKIAFIIAYLNNPEGYQLDTKIDEKSRNSRLHKAQKSSKKEKVRHMERPVETYTQMEQLYKKALRENKEDIEDVCKELGIPLSVSTNTAMISSVSIDIAEDDNIDEVLDFLGIPKPKTA